MLGGISQIKITDKHKMMKGRKILLDLKPPGSLFIKNGQQINKLMATPIDIDIARPVAP